jgi:hypothetical protein
MFAKMRPFDWVSRSSGLFSKNFPIAESAKVIPINKTKYTLFLLFMIYFEAPERLFPPPVFVVEKGSFSLVPLSLF